MNRKIFANLSELNSKLNSNSSESRREINIPRSHRGFRFPSLLVNPLDSRKGRGRFYARSTSFWVALILFPGDRNRNVTKFGRGRFDALYPLRGIKRIELAKLFDDVERSEFVTPRKDVRVFI